MSMQVVYINNEHFYCDGGEDYGHPRVYYKMDNGSAVCNYCSIKYILKTESQKMQDELEPIEEHD